MKNIILKFLPQKQQLEVSDNLEEYQDKLTRIEEQLNAIPDDYNSEMVYARYFNGHCDFFVLSWDRENDLLFCYSIINGLYECGNKRDQYITDLASGHANIEFDLYWKPKPLTQALHDRYPTFFPKLI